MNVRNYPRNLYTCWVLLVNLHVCYTWVCAMLAGCSVMVTRPSRLCPQVDFMLENRNQQPHYCYCSCPYCGPGCVIGVGLVGVRARGLGAASWGVLIFFGRSLLLQVRSSSSCSLSDASVFFPPFLPLFPPIPSPLLPSHPLSSFLFPLLLSLAIS